MKVEIKKLPKSKVEIAIETSAETLGKAKEKALAALKNEVEMKGFRKGRVPEEIIEKELGDDALLNRAAGIAIEQSYKRALIENKIEAISLPKVEVKKAAFGSPLEFKAEVQVLPEVSLPDYKKTAEGFERKEQKVEEKEIEDSLNWLRGSRAKFSAVLRPARNGDFVSIEFSSPDIDNGEMKKDSFILGKGYLISGFEKELEGMAEFEEKEFSLIFPKDHSQKELAGREIKFKAKMVSVQKVELPEIDDQFAKTVGNFDCMESLRENVRQGILEEKNREEKLRHRAEILKAIVEKTTCEIPEILVEREKEALMEKLKNEVSERFKMKPEAYFASIKKTEKEVFNSFSLEAEKRVKEFLILREIAKMEMIEVGGEEVEEEVNKILKNYPGIKAAKEKLDLEKLRDYVRESLTSERIFDILEKISKKGKINNL